MNLPTKRQIKAAVNDVAWDPLNKLIYDCCRKEPGHKTRAAILTKVMLIGRIYSVALERGRNGNQNDNEDYYRNVVYPRFRQMRLDRLLDRVSTMGRLSEDNIIEIIETHSYLVSELFPLKEDNKRSFASKYLHFHFPEQFPILDNRARCALSKYSIQIGREWRVRLGRLDLDREYAHFAYRIMRLQQAIHMRRGMRLTLREMDKLLLYKK